MQVKRASWQCEDCRSAMYLRGVIGLAGPRFGVSGTDAHAIMNEGLNTVAL